MSRTITIETEGLTVSRLAWDAYGSTAAGIVERIYALNPGLGKLGLILPIGTKVIIDNAPPASSSEREVIRLWD